MHRIIPLLCIALLLSGCGWIGQPPPPDEMEHAFQTYREEIQTVIDYLLTQEPPVTVYSSQELPENVAQAVKTLLRQAGCSSIHAGESQIHFVLWTRFTDAGCGIAYTKEQSLASLAEDFPFLIREQPLSEQGWYYYVEDYAKWRLERKT